MTFEVWLVDDAEYPGDRVLEEYVCDSIEEVERAISEMWAEFESDEHRKGILVFDTTKPFKSEMGD